MRRRRKGWGEERGCSGCLLREDEEEDVEDEEDDEEDVEDVEDEDEEDEEDDVEDVEDEEDDEEDVEDEEDEEGSPVCAVVCSKKLDVHVSEIGRASCRERVSSPV